MNGRTEAASTVLSYAQERSWRVGQLFPAQAPPNRSWVFSIDGDLDVVALFGALRGLTCRFDVLRARYIDGDGVPRQRFDATLTPTFTDLSGMAGGEARAAGLAAAQAAVMARLDLVTGPPWRAQLIRTGPLAHILVLVYDGAIMDDFSFPLFWNALAALYADSGQPVGDDDFAAYVARERTIARAYTQRRRMPVTAELSVVPPTEFPIDRPRPALRSGHGIRTRFAIADTISTLVHRLASAWRVDVGTVGLVAGAVLLGRYCRTDDLLIGVSTAAWGSSPGAHPLGIVSEPVPLIIDLKGKPTSGGLLDRIHGALNGPGVAGTPLGRLIEQLDPPRDLSRAPLFQISYTAAEQFDSRLPGLTVTRIELPATGTALDLEFALYTHGQQIELQVTRSSDCYSQRAIDRIGHEFEKTMAGIAVSPGASTSRLCRKEPSKSATRHPSSPGIAEGVRKAALDRPEACAISLGQQRLTYQELEKQSGCVARWLLARHVGPEAPVGILATRRLELPVMLLGILKSGGTFVPLEPGNPHGAEVRRQTDGITLVLDPAAPSMIIDDSSPPAAARPTDMDALLAYYSTSGSTGSAKTIAVTHRGVRHYQDYLHRVIGLSASDVVLQVAAVTFDASIRDMLCPLAAGARVVLLPDEAARDPYAILDQINGAGITAILAIVPTVLASVVDAATEPVSGLRVILISGERLDASLAARVRAWAPKARLINQYGLTECTMSSTYHEITAMDIARGVIPVGRVIPSATAYILDEDAQPLPAGALGEVYLGGPGLGRGYTDAALTAEHYLPDPFGPPGARLFRTGDLGRQDENGTLELYGRLDSQVKVRGVRVDLHECEENLRNCPGVDAAAVALRHGDLVAYITGTATSSELRRRLAALLPAPMVPNYYVTLTDLPLTRSGKLNRRALPDPKRASYGPCRPPRDALELHVRACWEDILDRDRIGVGENFFELGGDSLTVLRLCGRLSQQLGITLSPAEVFSNPTVEELCMLGPLAHAALSSQVLRLRRGSPATRPVVILPDITGRACRYQPLADAMDAGPSVFAVETIGSAPGDRPLRDISGMASACLPEVRQIAAESGVVLAGWGIGAQVAATLAMMLEKTGQSPPFVLIVDTEDIPAVDSDHDDAAQYALACGYTGPAISFPLSDGNAALAALLRHEQRRDQLPQRADLETMRRQIAVFTAGMAALDHGPQRLASELVVPIAGTWSAVPGRKELSAAGQAFSRALSEGEYQYTHRPTRGFDG